MTPRSGWVAILILCFSAAPARTADWQKVKSGAIEATYSDPKDAAAWLRLGEAEENLGNRAKASEAYGKVVELDASSETGKKALARLKALGAAQATPAPPPVEEKSAPAEPAPAPESLAKAAAAAPKNGFYFGFAPVYKPKIAKDLGSGIKMVADIGLRSGDVFLTALRFGRSVFGSLALPDGTRALRPVHTFVGVLVQGDIPIGPPNLLLDHIGFIVPIAMTPYMNVISARNSLFLNMGIDLAAGAGPRLNLGGVLIDVLALYHLGIPILKLKSATDETLTGADGQIITGTTNGFELRLGVTLSL